MTEEVTKILETRTIIKNDKPNSIEITQNTRGYNFVVKVHGNTADDIEKELASFIKVAKDKIKDLEQQKSQDIAEYIKTQ